MDKRGVSQIVTTILIILLSLAAIIIVWQAVSRLVKQPVTTDCVTVSLSIDSIDNLGNCVISDNDGIGSCSTAGTTSTVATACDAGTEDDTVGTPNTLDCAATWTETKAGTINIKRNVGAGDLRAVKVIIGGTTAVSSQSITVGELETVDVSIPATTTHATGIATGAGKVEIAPVVTDESIVCPVADDTTI